MTDPSDNLDGESEQPSGGEEENFELPLPDEEAGEARRLRRRPFGFKAGDVRAEIDAKDAELAELRRDVAALWLAFGQHERTIREVLETLERTSGVALDPPGGRAGPGQSGAAAAAPGGLPEVGSAPAGSDAASIGAQLSDLDQVLAAIEQATQTLERGYPGGGATEGEDDAEGDDAKGEDEPEPETSSEPGPQQGP